VRGEFHDERDCIVSVQILDDDFAIAFKDADKTIIVLEPPGMFTNLNYNSVASVVH
jgi:hypothetical protein